MINPNCLNEKNEEHNFYNESKDIYSNYSNELLLVLIDMLEDIPEGELRNKYQNKIDLCQSDCLKKLEKLINKYY